MKLEVKTYATLRKYAPSDVALGESFTIEIEEDTVSDVINHLQIPSDEKLVIMVNGIRITDIKHNLKDKDLVVFFPQIGGG